MARSRTIKLSHHRFVRAVGVVFFAILLFLMYLWLYVHVFNLSLPKTVLLRNENASWRSRMEQLSVRLNACERALGDLQMRDDGIYRSVFGMDTIPSGVRHSGLGGPNRYEEFEGIEKGSPLMKTTVRLDGLEKMAYVQSKSYDEIEKMSDLAGDRAAHIPAISPISTDTRTYSLSSPFGYRSDPLEGFQKLHSGMDFACKPGNPVYATGDGTVETASNEFFGYGNCIVIDHGFGYKTRYAHLEAMEVYEGMPVRRGQRIGTTGNSGRTTGPHLHYEIIYQDQPINPYGFMDLSLPPEEYAKFTNITTGGAGR